MESMMASAHPKPHTPAGTRLNAVLRLLLTDCNDEQKSINTKNNILPTGIVFKQ
jgi:hypothetical protein